MTCIKSHCQKLFVSVKWQVSGFVLAQWFLRVTTCELSTRPSCQTCLMTALSWRNWSAGERSGREFLQSPCQHQWRIFFLYTSTPYHTQTCQGSSFFTPQLPIIPKLVKDLLSLHLNSLSYPNLSRIFFLYTSTPYHTQTCQGSSFFTPQLPIIPKLVKDLLSLHLNSLSYPNLSRIFFLYTSTPYHTQTCQGSSTSWWLSPWLQRNVERANSSLKFIKTDLRSRMTQSRLNALLLLFIHKSIPVNPEAVVERFARAHPRRLLFTKPLIDDPADVESSASV